MTEQLTPAQALIVAGAVSFAVLIIGALVIRRRPPGPPGVAP